MSIEPITIPMSIESNEVTIDSTFDARIEVVEGGSITVESLSVNTNGTTTAPTGKAYSPVIVNVPASAVDTGTKNITSNGNNQDVVGYAKVNVAVPNSYSASDEGKVVSSGALVSQTSDTVTTNDTYDTTLINSLTVNVSGGGGSGIQYKSGTFTPSSNWSNTTARKITDIDTVGFTPDMFIVVPTSRTDGVSIAFGLVLTAYIGEEWFGTGDYLRMTCRTNTAESKTALAWVQSTASWTTSTARYLYFDGSDIKMKNDSQYIFIGNVEYTWYAFRKGTS